jgi:dihydrolipoamide dehydrogenase
MDEGPLGTTCARVGCMPSKVLIQIANDFHRRHVLDRMGISGVDGLSVNTAHVMKHVRVLRDRFSNGMVEKTKALGEQLIRGRARFLEPGVLEINGSKIIAENIIIATGSQPVIPDDWNGWGDRMITSDTLFELEDLPGSVAVIGLGVIGVEIGQALARLGVDVVGIDRSGGIAGLTDPEVNECAASILAQ